MQAFTIVHALGKLRKDAQAFLEHHHYTRSNGGSGVLYAALSDEKLVGALLIGPSASMAAERNIIAAPYRVWIIKRSLLLDDAPLVESQFLRFCMRAFAAREEEPIIYIAYADPAARDSRPGRQHIPLGGGCYCAAGMFYVGETSQPRYAVMAPRDSERPELGYVVRSSRQGKTTLHRGNLPEGWKIQQVAAARIWMAVVVPDRVGGRRVSRRRRRTLWLERWRALVPTRRVAAQQWIDRRTLRRLIVRERLEVLGAQRQERPHEVLARAWWQGWWLRRTAAPAWVPVAGVQLTLEEALGERTRQAHYQPLVDAETGKGR